MTSRIVWVDIPVSDLDRAVTFYSAVLGEAVKKEDIPGMPMAVLPHEGEAVGGCLYKMEDAKPGQNGPLIYLNAQGRLDQAISAVTQNGGKILQPKHSIAPHGFRAIVVDSEGNRVALHSM